MNSTNFANPEDLDILWTGAKYALTNQVDLTGAYYRYIQNDFNTTACTANKTAPYPGYAPQGASSSKCAGNLNAVSFMVDYHPWNASISMPARCTPKSTAAWPTVICTPTILTRQSACASSSDIFERNALPTSFQARRAWSFLFA